MRPTGFLLTVLALIGSSSLAGEAPIGQPGHTFRDCRNCPEMVVIPAGHFVMGAPASEAGRFDEEGPTHSVSVRAFAAGKFDVTRAQWAAFVTATKREVAPGCDYSLLPKGEEPKAAWNHLGFEQGDDHPVVCVTWRDAQDYARWLSNTTGHSYRLLTEAEWEYAARAGTTTAFPWGDKPDREHANYGKDECCGGEASGRDRWIATSPAGAFPPNGFGLYDMNGNVLQWVQDCFASRYEGLPADGSANERDELLHDPLPVKEMAGTSSCAYRMVRGGDWGDPGAMVRSAARNWGPGPGGTLATYRSAGLGFRVARSLN